MHLGSIYMFVVNGTCVYNMGQLVLAGKCQNQLILGYETILTLEIKFLKVFST